jgi:aspartate racemase
MKTIGLLGGMSWESSTEYYRIINQRVGERLGGLHSAICIMYSIDFAEIEELQNLGKWDKATELMIKAAQHVEDGGADFLIICTNTMHKMVDDVSAGIGIPILHIADATAWNIKDRGINTVGLLGTRYTMEGDFYKGYLEDKHGLEVLTPNEVDRDVIHRIIYEELVLGEVRGDSKEKYIEIMNKLIGKGVQGIILGCTEIGLLVKEGDVQVPVFDTTDIHATTAVDYALS